MKKITLLFLSLFITSITFSQSSNEVKTLLDEVSTKMNAYDNMFISFSQTLSNEEAGINEGDEPPIRGEINLQGEKYSLNYLGNKFIYDGKKLYVINNEEKEISITDGDMSGDDGFIYPSKLLTFYKEGYNFEMGKLQSRVLIYIARSFEKACYYFSDKIVTASPGMTNHIQLRYPESNNTLFQNFLLYK